MVSFFMFKKNWYKSAEIVKFNGQGATDKEKNKIFNQNQLTNSTIINQSTQINLSDHSDQWT